ncbi:uncharacterized protein LOC128714225 [Anopheles marshallii]|uniref:uncharacterized protein LOC128714225 n=1 Tax=Anopheles marshallii TaxID=1521116 RepID=UPI00237B5B1F|nr:uncharacterized protein LOC128714225 [Anopheles marshallii]
MESSTEDAKESDSFDWYLSRCFHNEYKTIPIRSVRLQLGRGDDNDFQFSPKTYHYLSRNHCILQIIDGKPTITDCDSQRGTFVNSTRLDKSSSGPTELKEGDRVGIGHKNDEIQQYFKFHSNILKYRVCRKIPDEEAIIISDGEIDAENSPTILPIITETTSSESLNQTQTSCQSNEIKICMPKAASPVPGPSGLKATECVSIPVELLRKSSFEEEYDMCMTRLNEDKVESDAEPCSSKFNDSEIIILSDDEDEYADLHHTQLVLEEVKKELADMQNQNICHNVCDDTNDKWTSMLKMDIDATQRYKEKPKEYKVKTDSLKKGKTENKSSSSKKERVETTTTKSNDKKQEHKSVKHSTGKENTKQSTETKDKKSHNGSLKMSFKRSTKDWVIANETNEEAKKLRKSVDSSATSDEAEDGEKGQNTDETVKLKSKTPVVQEPSKNIRQRRHSVADWAELQARKPHGVIEIVPPAGFMHRSPVWMTSSSTDPKLAGSDPKPTTTADASQTNGKPGLKRRGSIASPEEMQALFQKKFKPRPNVPDKIFEFHRISAAEKEQKEQRKNRLMEVNKKNQQKITPASDGPSVATKKTSSTKPKVKFTPNNRGMFLTAPIPAPPSRAASTSRPTSTEESIMCTQSTTLDQIPNVDSAEQVNDTRPKKLTFESMARVSNVDRPVPIRSELRKITDRRYSVIEPPTYLNPQPHASAKGNLIAINQNNTATGSQSFAAKTVQTTSNSTTSSNATHASRVAAPYVSLVQKLPLKSILKIYTPKNRDESSTRKRVTIMENLNKMNLIEKYIVPSPIAVQEHVLSHEQELLAEIFKWYPQWLIAQQTKSPRNVPFANEEKMMPNLEDYEDFECFRKLHTPFLIRELWNEVSADAKSMPLTLVASIIDYRRPKCNALCEIECEVSISTSEMQQSASYDFGIMEYQISPQQKRSWFFYNHTQVPLQYAANVQDKSGSHSTRAKKYILYAPCVVRSQLEPGQTFVLRPFTRILLSLRRANALATLKFSPLLCNILTPSFNVTNILTVTRRTKANSVVKNCAPKMEPGTLNSGQMNVLSSVLAECFYTELPTISIIQGPPGTGKSRVISHLILQLMHIARSNGTKMKVLMCAASNTAVDVIVKKLLRFKESTAHTRNLKVVRTGLKTKVDLSCMQVFIDKLIQDKISLEYGHDRLRNTTATEIKPPRTKEEITARSQILNEADIVCTTLGSCPILASYSLDIQFNVCIIDEATQCTELCTLLPLQYKVSKLVLVGDIHQLPATVLDQQSIEAGFRKSLFSRIYQSYIDKQKMDELKVLTTQYRMHPDICHWPNEYFYQRQLKSAPCTEAQRKDIPLKPYMVISLSYDQELTQAQYEIYNKDEIRFVVGLVKKIVACCSNRASVAIITPYARHREELIQTLRNLSLQRVEVHSIDSVQGKEFDVVIISLARSNGTGFLDQPERINVAMTRARQCLVLCGNFNSLQHKPVWSSLLADAQKRKVYYQLEDHDAHAYGEQMVQNIMQRLRKN